MRQDEVFKLNVLQFICTGSNANVKICSTCIKLITFAYHDFFFPKLSGSG